MSKKKSEISYSKSFRFDDAQSEYVFRLKKRRNLWWLLLLLLLPLLLIRCEREITVICVDDATNEPLRGAATTLSYNVHHIYAKDKFLYQMPVERELMTDAEGKAVYDRLPCNVFSYIFYMFQTVKVTGDLYPYTAAEATRLFHYTSTIELRMKCDTTARDVDIVMCVDNTGSMDDVIDMVKRNARGFHSDIISHASKAGKAIRKMRVKVIVYGDFIDGPMSESDFFDLPSQTDKFNAYVNSIDMTDGDDEPENGLEALSLAMKTPWTGTGTSRRHVIVVYTDASTLPLGARSSCSSYPSGLAGDMDELRAQWDSMDHSARRLVLFAPADEHWIDISTSWPDVDHHTGELETELSGDGYETVLNGIIESL